MTLGWEHASSLFNGFQGNLVLLPESLLVSNPDGDYYHYRHFIADVAGEQISSAAYATASRWSSVYGIMARFAAGRPGAARYVPSRQRLRGAL